MQKQKQFQNKYPIQGFPCYLVPSKWRKTQKQYLYKLIKLLPSYQQIVSSSQIQIKTISVCQSQKIYLPFIPITNFSMINHIYQIIPYTDPFNKSYLNNLLFPQCEYQIITKKHWQYLQSFEGFTGFVLKGLYMSQKQFRYNRIGYYYQKNIVKIVIKIQTKYYNNRNLSKKYDQNKSQFIQKIIQVPKNYIWAQVYNQIWKKIGLGQLKILNDQQYYQVISDGHINNEKRNLILVFIPFSDSSIYKLTPEQIKYRNKFLLKYDFQPYNPIKSKSLGLIGLKNDSLICYLNSSIQCLSQTLSLSEYILKNQHLKNINYSIKNIHGSRGDVICAFSDLIKKLWSSMQKQNKSWRKSNNQVDSMLFKDTFGRRFDNFNEYRQEDAHEFLNFLLNCLHDDLNSLSQANNIKRIQNFDSKNFKVTKDNFIQNYQSKNKSIITDLFKGYTYSTLQCLQCNLKYYNFDMHLTIPIPIPEQIPGIQFLYFNSETLCQKAVRVSIMIKQTLITVKDLIQVIRKQVHGNGRKKSNPFFGLPKSKQILRQQNEQYILLKFNKRTFQFQQKIKQKKLIFQLLTIQKQKKSIFCLYRILIPDQLIIQNNNLKQNIKDQQLIDEQIQQSSNNKRQTKRKNNKQIKQNEIKIQKQIENKSHNEKSDVRLIFIKCKYNDKVAQYPKLAYMNIYAESTQIQKFAYSTINFDQLQVFSNTQNKQDYFIDKIKIQKNTNKNSRNIFPFILKIYFKRKISLFEQYPHIQKIGYEQQQQRTKKFNLTTCFQIFNQKQLIEIQQEWKCQHCNKICPAQKQQKIYSVSNHLIIVLKRFKENQKLNTRIQYPLQGLDISKFVHEEWFKQQSRRGSWNQNNKRTSVRINQENNKINMNNEKLKEKTFKNQNQKNIQGNSNFIFDLYGVVMHSGSLDRGHYYAYCKNPINKKWYILNDQYVKQEQDQSSVINQNAYILFYKIRDQV